jgi:uncharacterized membrane protein
MSLRARRLAIGGLSFAGIVEALYMLAYDEGLLDSLWCPFFGKGCEIVGRSKHAKHFGVPNAAVGAVAYAGMADLALWAGDRPDRRWQPALLSAIAAIAAAASGFLIYEQGAKVRAWCFWCLSTSAINTIILPISMVDAREALRQNASRPRAD